MYTHNTYIYIYIHTHTYTCQEHRSSLFLSCCAASVSPSVQLGGPQAPT